MADQGFALRRRSLELLEFPRLREMLADRTSFPPARELALALEPGYRAEEIARLQGETAEARLLLRRRADLDLAAPDIRPHLKRAGLQGALTGAELREVHAFLRTARLARRAVQRWAKELPWLASLAEPIPELPELEEEIDRDIDPKGEVRDGATPELRRLRKQVRLAHERLVAALNRIIRSPLGREVLQEPLIVVRSERLVLSVRTEMKSRLKGLVHDVSDSGATAFIEPLSTVPLGNAWRELVLEMKREELRVLRCLSSRIGEQAPALSRGVEGLARLDLAVAKARLANYLGAGTPRLADQDSRRLRLVNARHPLLSGGAVPITLELGGDRPVLVITGPNAGGKTVALKTAGLFVLMYQAGLALPADPESSLPVFDGVYADIGDQQSIEQSRSTFSAHITTIAAILEAATSASLVLLDELGTSTDPEEGAALAKAVLRHLAGRGIATIATGHYGSVADFASGEPGMNNASVELDPVTLSPTFRLTMGLPGRSYALVIASRLGLSGNLVQEARSLVSPERLSAEDLLADLQRERHAALEKRLEAEEASQKAEALRRELEARLREMEERRAEMLAEARRELLSRAEEVRERLRQAERAVEQARNEQALREAQARLLQVRRELRGEEWRPAPTGEPPWWSRLQPGDRVRVKGWGLPATVVSAPDESGTVEVQMGATRGRFDASLLAPAGGEGPPPAVPARPLRSAPVSAELNLRGKRVADALEELEAFLDRAVLAGLSSVRLLHGRGTGALRQALRERLARHPLVKTFSPGEPPHQEAVTVVELK